MNNLIHCSSEELEKLKDDINNALLFKRIKKIGYYNLIYSLSQNKNIQNNIKKDLDNIKKKLEGS